MPLGLGARLGLGIVGVAGLVSAASLALMMAPSDVIEPREETNVGSTGSDGPRETLEGRAARLSEADTEALEQCAAAAIPPLAGGDDESTETPPMSEEQLASWLADLPGLGAGFTRFGPIDRDRIITMVGEVMDRLAVRPAPERWIETLSPIAELLTAGLADASPAVRAGAAEVVGRAWSWQPGCSTWPDADRTIASWKNRLHTPLVTLLDDSEPGVRLAAVLAMGKLPIDAMAEPAIALIDDEVPAIRMQLVNSFAHRRELLTEEQLLPLLYDTDTAVALAAQIVLRARGLNDELIDLAKLLYHPRAELRASAIPQIEQREDIDPIIWLLRLSRDEDAEVRSAALQALGRATSPDARRRVAEMADSDPSPEIRAAARRTLDELTADLPPLPDSPDLYPRAN